jgi:hypothetical protein
MLVEMAFLLMPALDAGTAERFAELALSCVHREYPNKIAHVLNGDGDVRPPRELTPAFYGCFDWHSSVHGHWLLARLARLFPEAAFAERARAALAKSLTEENLRREVAYFNAPGRATFERPYGLAWLLTLAQELREMGSPHAAAMAPLERAVVERLTGWLPKLSHPVRSGEHSQTAFALGLALDYARAAGDRALEQLLVERAEVLREGRGVSGGLRAVGGGLSFAVPGGGGPDAAGAGAAEFARWFDRFMPSLPYRC